jgi:hypothetical protein
MSGTVVYQPNNPPTSGTDWETFLSSYAIGGKGQNNITLTNWSIDPGEPAIAAGSSIEVNGEFILFKEEEAIDFSNVSNNSDVYVVIDVTSSEGEALAIATETAPSWDAEKSGLYSGSNRYTGHMMYISAGGSYSFKRLLITDPGNSCQVAIYVSYGFGVIEVNNAGLTDLSVSDSANVDTTKINDSWTKAGFDEEYLNLVELETGVSYYYYYFPVGLQQLIMSYYDYYYSPEVQIEINGSWYDLGIGLRSRSIVPVSSNKFRIPVPSETWDRSLYYYNLG